MNRKNRITSGTNAATVVTPAHTPSRKKPRTSSGSGANAGSSACWRTRSKSALKASWSGLPRVNTPWNTRNIIRKNSGSPNSGCSSTRSRRSVNVAGRRAGTSTAVAMICAASFSSAASSGGAKCATRLTRLSPATPWASAASACAWPSPRFADMRTTGTPSARRSAGASMRMPSRRASSSMLRSTTTGMPCARRRSTKGSWRSICGAAAITAMRSASVFARNVRTTCSSSAVPSRS